MLTLLSLLAALYPAPQPLGPPQAQGADVQQPAEQKPAVAVADQHPPERLAAG